ncbi:VasL domain-containing protein [Escherichia coli]
MHSKIKRVIPDAFLTEMLVNYSGCSEYTSNQTDSWSRLRKKMDGFEETLNTIEKNRGYITISKLKTIAHDMKNTLLEYPPSLNIRLSNLYNNEYTDKEDIKKRA